jgi:hypothetical protein
MRIFRCVDFIDSGFWKADDCCSFCHGEEAAVDEVPLLVSPIKNSRVFLCCKGRKIVEDFNRSQWAKLLWDKRKNK